VFFLELGTIALDILSMAAIHDYQILNWKKVFHTFLSENLKKHMGIKASLRPQQRLIYPTNNPKRHSITKM